MGFVKFIVAGLVFALGIGSGIYLAGDYDRDLLASYPTAKQFRGQGSLARIEDIPSWSQINGLDRKQRAFLGRVVASLPKVSASSVELLAKRTVIDNDVSTCPPTHHRLSCVTIQKRKIHIHLSDHVLRDNQENGYLILHEFGHALAHIGIDKKERAELLGLRPGFAKAWPGLESTVAFDNEHVILTESEMWAEQWAMWACECESASEYAVKRFGNTNFSWGAEINKRLRKKSSQRTSS